MGVSGQHHAQGRALPPGKGPPVPIVQEAGWAIEARIDRTVHIHVLISENVYR
jgi:hypothetical protein